MNPPRRPLLLIGLVAATCLACVAAVVALTARGVAPAPDPSAAPLPEPVSRSTP